MNIKLSKNERSVLKILVENSRTCDSEIANKLNISSQAVGKIRKKLEENIIESYSVNLKYEQLDVKTFAIAIAKITPEGFEKGHLEVEAKLLNDDNIIQVYRLPRGTETHIIIMGFKDISELDKYFHSEEKISEIHQYIQTKELFTFSHNSIIKNNPKQLLNMAINQINKYDSEIYFGKIENIKMKL